MLKTKIQQYASFNVKCVGSMGAADARVVVVDCLETYLHYRAAKAQWLSHLLNTIWSICSTVNNVFYMLFI